MSILSFTTPKVKRTVCCKRSRIRYNKVVTEIYLLALVVCLASGLAILVRRYKQPLVVSYVVAGVLLSVFGLVRPEQLQFLKFLPEIGLAFLLFMVGMELDLGEFKSLGKNILIVGLGQIAVSGVLLFWLTGSWIAGIALSFSSTILVVKMLIEERELVSLQGKLVMGIALLEDLVAVVLLIFLGLLGSGQNLSFVPAVLVLAKAAFLIWLALFAGKRLLPRVFQLTADNQELLFLTGIGWCLLFVSLASYLGVSVAIGAFLAGVSLAQSVYRVQISGRIKPLRDFFIMLFFIDLGAEISLSALGSSVSLLTLLVGYTLLIKPAIFFLTLMALRFRVHTAFKSAILLSSISEFSLISVYLAASGGLLSKDLVSVVVFATVLSFVLSSFLITHGQVIFSRIKVVLKKVERKKTFSIDFVPEGQLAFSDHAVLVGCHRSGEIILKALKKFYGENVLVLDFNPEVVENLKNNFISSLYGDIADPEVLEKLNLKQAKLVVSTVRDLRDNLALLDAVEKMQSKVAVIVTAADSAEAVKLYERGAHHVSLPLTLEGLTISRLISDYQGSLGELTREREKKLGELKRSNSINQ